MRPIPSRRNSGVNSFALRGRPAFLSEESVDDREQIPEMCFEERAASQSTSPVCGMAPPGTPSSRLVCDCNLVRLTVGVQPSSLSGFRHCQRIVAQGVPGPTQRG